MTRVLAGALLALAFADGAAARVHLRPIRHEVAAIRPLAAPTHFHGTNPGARDHAGWRRSGWGA